MTLAKLFVTCTNLGFSKTQIVIRHSNFSEVRYQKYSDVPREERYKEILYFKIENEGELLYVTFQ